MAELRWQDLKEMLADALEVEPAQRPEHLLSVCGDDVELRRRLEELLQYDAGQNGGMDRPEEASAPEADSSPHPRVAGERYAGIYRLLEPIGEGGMGMVYKAEQRYPVKRFVAVKLIRPGYDTEEVIARFESERQALARMDHPCIAKVFDAGADERGRPYFVMEYVPGAPITRFADEAKLSIERRLELFLQVCDAVAHAHTKAIIHRDLKPSNIMAYFADGQAVAKTIDFGIAKALSGDRLTDHTFNTSRGQPIGTYESMSPEQASGTVDIDTRTDVYSLGVLLYELLSGIKPFDRSNLPGADDQELRRNIREVEATRPSVGLRSLGAEAQKIAEARNMTVEALSRQLQSELEWVPLMAMRKEPARRYGSVAELASDVRNYLVNLPLKAGPEGRIYRLRKYARRNRPALLTAAAFAVVIGFAAGSYIRGMRLEQKKTQAALNLVQNQRDEAQRQEQIAAAVNKFLQDMLATADPYKLLGEKVTVLEATQAAVKELDRGAMRGQPLVEAALRQSIGNTLRRLSRYKEAEPNLRRALELRKRVLAADDPKIAETMNDLGVLLRSQRRFIEAEQVHRAALKILEGKLPPNDPAIATSLTSLASVLQGEERLLEAEGHYRRALMIRRAALPPDDPQLAESLDNLAVVLRNQKKVVEAEPLSVEALKRRRETLKPGDPDIAKSLQNLSVVLRDQGRYEDAEPLTQEALDIYRKAFGAGNPAIIKTLISLGKLKKLQKKPNEAEPLLREARENLERAIAIGRQSLPANSADHTNNLHLLAQLQLEQKKPDEAKLLLREAVLVSRNAVPPDDLNLARSLNDLGDLLLRQSELQEAETVCTESLQKARLGLPPGEAAIVGYINPLVGVLLQRGKPAEARELMKEAVRINRSALPPEDPNLAASLSSLAQIVKEDDQVAAEQLLRESIAIYRRAYPAGELATAARLAQLASLLWARNKNDPEVDQLLNQALAIRSALSRDQLMFANDEFRQTGSLVIQVHSSNAESLLRSVLLIQREKLGISSDATRHTAADLSELLERTGRREEADGLRREFGLPAPVASPTERRTVDQQR